MQSSRRLELYRNGIKNHGRQLPVAGDRADLPDRMSKGTAGRSVRIYACMVLNLRASRAYICPEVTWRSPECGADANGCCARKPIQAFVPILPHGGGYLSTRLDRGRAHLLSAAHRNTGVFDAALYGIDRLKEIVPVWKKEIGPQGQEWVEGSYIPKPGR